MQDTVQIWFGNFVQTVQIGNFVFGHIFYGEEALHNLSGSNYNACMNSTKLEVVCFANSSAKMLHIWFGNSRR